MKLFLVPRSGPACPPPSLMELQGPLSPGPIGARPGAVWVSESHGHALLCPRSACPSPKKRESTWAFQARRRTQGGRGRAQRPAAWQGRSSDAQHCRGAAELSQRLLTQPGAPGPQGVPGEQAALCHEATSWEGEPEWVSGLEAKSSPPKPGCQVSEREDAGSEQTAPRGLVKPEEGGEIAAGPAALPAPEP